MKNNKLIVMAFMSMAIIVTGIIVYQFTVGQLEINAKNEKIEAYKHKVASFNECAKQVADNYKQYCTGLK